MFVSRSWECCHKDCNVFVSRSWECCHEDCNVCPDLGSAVTKIAMCVQILGVLSQRLCCQQTYRTKESYHTNCIVCLCAYLKSAVTKIALSVGTQMGSYKAVFCLCADSRSAFSKIVSYLGI